MGGGDENEADEDCCGVLLTEATMNPKDDKYFVSVSDTVLLQGPRLAVAVPDVDLSQPRGPPRLGQPLGQPRARARSMFGSLQRAPRPRQHPGPAGPRGAQAQGCP